MDEYISREALIDHVMAYGRQIGRCVVVDQRGVRFEIGNWGCDGRIYFVIKADGNVGVCDEVCAKENAANVVEVVRCGDCVYGEQYDEEIEDWRECRYDGCGLAYEISHFCSHGKRKDGEQAW